MHSIVITCDTCGKTETFGERRTDITSCIEYLIEREGWQRATFEARKYEPDDDWYPVRTVTELYCPACIRYPDAERTDRDRSIDEIQNALLFAANHEHISVAYNLVDRLYDLCKEAHPQEDSHAAD